jgi:adenine-specific DNA methylase
VPTLAVLEPYSDRKARGAFFTPPAIAEFLAYWAIQQNPHARLLDPSSGDGVFLKAAGEELRRLGTPQSALDSQIYGVDLHPGSVHQSRELLAESGLGAHLLESDFFAVTPPTDLFANLEPFDAVIGNPPYIRYQQHIGKVRQAAAAAALRQGVRVSGLASSWAPLLVHAAAFLKPEGWLAMVLPAELLTVGYAEPVRRWLRERFAAVRLVLFETLQFSDALENVVLLLANGSGGCDGFSLYHVHDAQDLRRIPFTEIQFTPSDVGKWTELLLSMRERQLFKRVLREHFVGLTQYATVELGTVTGSNDFFTLTDETRTKYGLTESQLKKISPPGTRHLRGMAFTNADWESQREKGESVWILHPDPADRSRGLQRYVAMGKEQGIDQAYKCTVRTPWWRPPVVSAPDLFFTYMSHRFPRMVTNRAKVTFVNSMHGVRLRRDTPKMAREALSLLSLNSVTMLGAEVFGRSYGGGILKMEPSEAASLPVPSPRALLTAWEMLKGDRAAMDRELRTGLWTTVAARVDDVLLRQVMKLSQTDAEELAEAATKLRARRLGRTASAVV